MTLLPRTNRVQDMGALVASLMDRLATLERVTHRHDAGVAYVEASPSVIALDLNDITLGAGGTNQCEWVYIGTMGVGGRGFLHLDARLIMGTSPSVGTAAGFHLPDGFNFDIFTSTTNVQFISTAKYSSGGTGGIMGQVRYLATVPCAQFQMYQDSGTEEATVNPAGLAWAAGWTIYWRAIIPVIRTA